MIFMYILETLRLHLVLYVLVFPMLDKVDECSNEEAILLLAYTLHESHNDGVGV